jgi:hypothetical protein
MEARRTTGVDTGSASTRLVAVLNDSRSHSMSLTHVAKTCIKMVSLAVRLVTSSVGDSLSLRPAIACTS